MGTQLSSIITSREIDISELRNKKLIVDGQNILYQFLSTIRQRDGTPLKDSKGNVTSHLSGLFFRTTKLMKENIKLGFVFDGSPPELKKEERKRRKSIKEEARRKYEEAVDEGDIELMRKYASRTSRLTTEMIEESKELLLALGIPVIQAPSEGEAQAAHLVKEGKFYALVGQDTDGLLFGSPRTIKNLSITGRRKKTGKQSYTSTNPEEIDLAENLNRLGIDKDQLIVIGMLCGTDFNVGGIKGLGPKKSLALVKKHKKDFDALFKEAAWDDHFDYSWKKVFNIFKNIEISHKAKAEWTDINKNKVLQIMVDNHEFSKERIESSLNELLKTQAQKGLGEFF